MRNVYQKTTEEWGICLLGKECFFWFSNILYIISFRYFKIKMYI